MSTYVGNAPKYAQVPMYTITSVGSTTCPLTWTPGTAQSCLVFIGGVQQRPTTDYTVSGTTLTLVQAPPIGATITVIGLAMQGLIGVPTADSVLVSSLNSAFVLPIAQGGTGATNLNAVSTGGNLYLAANFGGF